MSAAEKISVRVFDIGIEATDRKTAKALLAHALEHTGVVNVSRDSSGACGGPLPPALGEVWPGHGGIYVGTVRGEDGQPDYHLVLATNDAAKLKGEWGKSGVEIKGASSRNDGLSNTKAMAEAGSALARSALALKIDGHSDFYLPAQAELMLCFANVREQFEKEWHWSSTQCSAGLAWLQFFSFGDVGCGGKTSERLARAVRRVQQ